MKAQGTIRYTPDYDRGVIIKDLPDGRVVHRYVDENVWRDAFGNIIPYQEATRG